MIKDYFRAFVFNCQNKDHIPLLLKPGTKALELGVGKGHNLNLMSKQPNISKTIGIDRYAGDRGHDESEEKNTRLLVGDRATIIKGSFEDTVDNYKHSEFGYIYFDGYAHQNNLQHLFDWWDKLCDWGILVVCNYDDKFPETKQAVNEFMKHKGIKRFFTCPGAKHQAWFTIKVPNPAKRIILIGNGHSVFNREFGADIDSFDEIYRFNCFKIAGHEKNVGTRTDAWVLNQSPRDVMPMLRRMKNGNEPWPEFERFFLAPYYCLKKYGDREVPIKSLQQYNVIKDYGKPIQKVSQETYWNASRVCKIEEPIKKKKQATTGTITIQHLIEAGYNNITLCGFDMALSGEKHLPHYFEKNNPHTWHYTQKEHKYLRHLIELGLIKLLV
jgi:hypothetical protein